MRHVLLMFLLSAPLADIHSMESMSEPSMSLAEKTAHVRKYLSENLKFTDIQYSLSAGAEDGVGPSFYSLLFVAHVDKADLVEWEKGADVKGEAKLREFTDTFSKLRMNSGKELDAMTEGDFKAMVSYASSKDHRKKIWSRPQSDGTYIVCAFYTSGL